jgi:cell wall-associated NlpC family hydrolase
MDVTTLLARARSTLNKGIPYKLGAQGDPTLDALPSSGVDCSGFVLWVLRHEGPDMDTSMIVNDAKGPTQYFTPLPAGPRAGCLIVYPDYVATVMGKALKHDGHVGIVTETGVQGGKPVVQSVIHCSGILEGVRSGLMPGAPVDAILETGPLWFPAFGAIFVWYRSITMHA